ncbi:Hypothetical predicted protein [Mytilus galloprovincialis]|uniref:Phosphoribosylglycinamide synthetase N-terminal domain-containing protein n=1 Tax=Mytilus galloprovincialis TaxID=29158 RepID=A0A8B6FTG0_MYTGA|nr:Hypothetical predicted protein [Mytilus galloprovincialis]
MVLAGGAVWHAIAWAFAESRHVDKVFVSPPGHQITKQNKKISSVGPLAGTHIAKTCIENKITMIISNQIYKPEIMKNIGKCRILYFGPIDSTNMFEDPSMIKEFILKYNIPTSKAVIFKKGQPVNFD